MKTSPKVAAAAILAVIILGSVTALYLSRLSIAHSISLAPTTFVAVQGTRITFTIYGLEPNGIVTIYFGDGHEANSTSSATYVYQNPGRYLVAAQEFVNGQPIASTFNALQTIQITPQIDPSLAPLISIPVVSVDVARNPSAPVVRAGDQVYFYGGFLEPPTGSYMTIAEYDWDFGNGVTKTVAANSNSFKPADNPATAAYSKPGLYPVTLTLVTQNSTSMTTYRTSVGQTVAVGSSRQPYAVFLYAGIVPNPSLINVAENLPGGPDSFDPHIEYGSFAAIEVLANIYSTLLIYNGSSTTQFIPMAAAQVPSLANGGISPDYTTYTFQVRKGLKFSNGDSLTAYDVWYSMIRMMLFVGGVPTTASAGGLDQYLVPGAYGAPIITNASDTGDFNAIMSSITYSNSSNTVTFKLFKPVTPTLFFDLLPTNILDSRWLEQVGAGITFTPAGFYTYQNQANAGSYNLKIQYAPVASGPYMIQSYAPGQTITLVPNPGYPGVPGIPAVHNTVVIQWIKDVDTEYNLFRSGQADIASWFLGVGSPPNYYPQIKQLVANGQAALYQFPSLFAFYMNFDLAVNETAMRTDFGSQYHIPSDYFTNLDVRKAFAYAFNYTRYIYDLQGRVKYGVNFGSNYAGAIVQGVPYYVPESQLQNVPTYNLTYAKQLLQQSGEYGASINIPVPVPALDVPDYEGVEMWAAALNSIDPNIVMTPTYLVAATLVAYRTPGSNPMPIFVGGFSAPPYASFYVDGLYAQGGYETAVNGWTVQYLNESGHRDEAGMFAEMNSLIQVGDSTTNATLAAQDYKQAEQIAINLYMYVYLIQANSFWLVKPYMTGYQGQISYQMNPVWGGDQMGQYYWWVKGCETPEACTGRNVGP